MDKELDNNDGKQLENAFKKRKLRTAAAFLTFLGLGLSNAVQGPTLVNMMELLNTDVIHISLAMSVANGGYLVSAIVCGILFDRLDSELQFSIACIIESIALILAPWSHDVYTFMVVMAIQGFAMGYIDTGGNAYILKLWQGHPAKDPILQSIHFMWSVGSTLSPFLVRPFLVEKAINKTDCGKNKTDVTMEQYWTENVNTLNTTDFKIADDCNQNRDITLVRYAYMLVGFIILLIAILYIIMYISLGHHLLQTEKVKNVPQKVNSRGQKKMRCFQFGLLSLIFVFYFFCLVAEAIGGGYVSLFVVSSFEWSVKRGALLTAAFWGSHCFGLFLGIPLSYLLSAKIMLYIAIVPTGIGYCLLFFSELAGDVLIFVSIVIAGMGVSTIFPSMLLWISDYIPSHGGTVSAVSLTGSSLGVVLGFPIVGGLMEKLSPMCYVYSVVTASVMLLVLFIIMQVYALASSNNKKEDNVQEEEEESMNTFA